MTNIRTLLLVDSDRAFLDLARLVFAAAPRIEIVGHATLWPEALAKASVWQPDLVLLDVRLAGADYHSAVVDIKRRSPDSKVVFMLPGHATISRDVMVAARADGDLELHQIETQLPSIIESLFGPL